MYGFMRGLQDTIDAIKYAQEVGQSNGGICSVTIHDTEGPRDRDIIDVTDFTVKEEHGDESQTEKILIEAES